MKKVLFALTLTALTLTASEELSFWEKAKLDAKVYLEKTKKYSISLAEKGIQKGINRKVDTKFIKVEKVKLYGKNSILLDLKLKGEDKNVKFKIVNFDWGVTKDKKLIVLENLKLDIDSPWIEHIYKYYIDANNGYYELPYKVSTKAVLTSIKSQIKTTYNGTKAVKSKEWEDTKTRLSKTWKFSNKKDIRFVVAQIYDENYIKVNSFNINNNYIDFDLSLKGSKDNFVCTMSNLDWGFGNNKDLLVIKNIKFKECSKPWIKSIIKKQNNEVHFTHTKNMENILRKIKKESYFK